MRNLALVSVSFATIAGIVSFNLWRELRAERELTASLRAELVEVAARPPLQGQYLFAPPPSAAAPAVSVAPQPVAAAARVQEPAPVVETPPASAAANPTTAQLNASLLRQQQLLEDPEYRDAQLAQLRFLLPQNHPGLAEELGLSPAEAGKLFDLLAQHQLDTRPLALLAADGNVDQAMLQERSRAMAEVQHRQQAELRELLGGRYQQWETYQQNRPAHTQVAQLRRTLDSVGQPLTDAQVRPLVAAMSAEQQRMRQDQTNMFRNSSPGDPQSQARLLAEMQEDRFRLQAESNRRVLDVAGAHLTTAQLDTFRSVLDAQLAMNRASLRAAQRVQTEAQGGAVTGHVVVPISFATATY